MVPPVSSCSTKEACTMEIAYPPRRAKSGQRLAIAVGFPLDVGLTQTIATAEKENKDALAEAGFSLDFGEDGSVISGKCLCGGGGVLMIFGFR